MGASRYKQQKPPVKAVGALASKVLPNESVTGQVAASSDAPDGNHGDNNISTPRYPQADRYRLSVDLSPIVMTHLDHISSVTGQTKSAIIGGALLDSLPALIARADGFRSRHLELGSPKR
jgi:hypothetical protein